jgi:hypothetical protein
MIEIVLNIIIKKWRNLYVDEYERVVGGSTYKPFCCAGF